MGLFSKKTFVCEKCGKEFEKRIMMGEVICTACATREYDERQALNTSIPGYIDYKRALFFESYTVDEMKQVEDHRNKILEKYRQTNGISRTELINASDNYKKLTDEESNQILLRVANSTVSVTAGAAYNGKFFTLSTYNRVVVDVEDVFAVGFTTARKASDGNNEAILCVVFTNDPYIPVFPMIYMGKVGYFQISKSKKGRESVVALFESICPNLTYPVTDIKQLKKVIKQEGEVKGNIGYKNMQDYISRAESNSGIFDVNKMSTYISATTINLLEQYGYLPEDEINLILKMDKMLNRNYWNKQMQRLING